MNPKDSVPSDEPFRAAPERLWGTALVLGWAFDFLFWQHAVGLSFPLFVALCLAGGIGLLRREGYAPARQAWLPAGAALLFALLTIVRLEPFTRALNAAFSLALLALFAVSYRSGRWPAYGLLDYVERAFWLVLDVPFRPLMFLAGQRRSRPVGRVSWRQRLLPVLRGLLLALPVLLVFGALLAEADPIFAQRLGALLRFFDLARLGEYLVRLALILLLAWLLAGVFLHAARRAEDRLRSGVEPFLGLTEAGVVLLAVEALFAFFVAVQFRYFFGGEANVTAAGFSYATYARRGFGELVAVALFSLLLSRGLGVVTRREGAARQRRFAALNAVLVGLVLIILASAYQRLVLYEDAYGFTRTRTAVHLFMVWLGALLAALAVFEWQGQSRRFALAALIAAVGFGITLNAINVDGFVARHNLLRAAAGASLDTSYLRLLSDDALPAQAALLDDPRLPPALRERLARQLACLHAVQQTADTERNWRAWTWSRWRAERTWARLAPRLRAYTVEFSPRQGWQITDGNTTAACWGD